ncbi:MAG TPA: NAD(P)/FAD-dependent oxidoreductase [Spirochaetota bacterium]|nr:NAD(P)/FAD-dependent oxidoreductase [Spirochaetota bacterium]HPU86988.1 NAD(P)/FAD-dependent oxidoreductase [Spirochaetota bacterium]
MKTKRFDFDVAIAGAGPGGTLAALRLAEAGLSVGLFDALPEVGLGRSLVLETEPTVYSEVGLPLPSGDTVPYECARLRVLSARGRELFSFDEREHALPVAINLDVFVKGLLVQAKRAGARFVPGTRVISAITSGERVTGFICKGSDGRDRHVNARITIDATGFAAALVRSLPASFGFEFPESSRHVVSAANCLHRLVPAKADAAIGNGLFAPDEIIARMGTTGSYSTVYSFLSKRDGTAYLLVGLKRDHERIITARQVVDAFVRDAGCFGTQVRAAAAPIRIRHSLDRMVAGGFMALGEAACTVFPMHGSGVASALITATLASGVAVNAIRGNDVSAAALWSYAAAYQRGRGRRLAGYDVTRLTVDSLSADDVASMLESGIMQAEDTLNGLQVNEPRISARTVPARIRGFSAHPTLLPPIARMGMTLRRVLDHYARYPERDDPVAFTAWCAKKKRIFGRLLEERS